MNKNMLIVLGGALLAAVLVAVLVQITFGGKDEVIVAPSENTVEVLVVAKDLDQWHTLEEGDLRWQSWPEDAVFKAAIMREDAQPAHDIVQGRLTRAMEEGEVMVESALMKEGARNNVQTRLEAGERAISISVKAQSMVSGFIRPGAYVDVILTYKHRMGVDDEEPAIIHEMIEKNIDKLATETILENVRVLAIDQKAEYEDEDKIYVGKTVTLAVSMEKAEKLALASEMGAITLVMRGVGDENISGQRSPISDARLTTIDDELFSKYHALKKEAGINNGNVKIYNGAQVQTMPVQE